MGWREGIELIIGFWTLAPAFFLAKATLDTRFETQRDLPINMIVYLYSFIPTGLLLIGMKDMLMFELIGGKIHFYVLIPSVLMGYLFNFILIRGLSRWEELEKTGNISKHARNIMYSWIVLPVVLYVYNHDMELTLQIALLHQLPIMMIVIASAAILNHHKKSEVIHL